MINSRIQGSANIVIIAILVTVIIGSLGFVYWKNNTKKENIGNSGLLTVKGLRSTEDWVVYENDTLPFIFDYPKGWLVAQEEAGVFSLSDSTDRKIMSIEYVKMPRGMTRGVALCQVKSVKTNQYCSYINNELVGHFFGQAEDYVWRGVLNKQNADIVLTLISKGQKSKNILVGVAESMRLKP